MRPVTHVHPETGLVQRSHVRRDTPCGKNGYSGRKLAVTRAKAASKATGETIEAYHCKGCHAWHIGHPPGTRQQVA